MDAMRRVALVTGGSRGIGRAVALRLAHDGAAVAVAYRRDREAAEATVGEIVASGGRALAFRSTIGDRDDEAELASNVRRELGPVGIFVSNAGISSLGQDVVDSDLGEFQRLLDVHLLGPIHLCQLLVPEMRGLGRGDIVFVSSVATDLEAAGHGPYTIAKAGVESLASTLAKEEAAHGVRVNVVAPGLVDTNMGDRMVHANNPDFAGVQDLEDHSPFGRVVRPDDVASLIEFLTSQDGAFVTGQRIAVHGGAPDVVELISRPSSG